MSCPFVHKRVYISSFILFLSATFDLTPSIQGARRVCQSLALDGLVVIGGDDSNTNAAVLGTLHCFLSSVLMLFGFAARSVDFG